MKGRKWTPEEDAILREMVEAGREYRSIGRKLKRSMDACKCRASVIGVKLSRDAILANRARGRDRFYRNERKASRRMERLMKSYTPLDRAIRAEEGRQRQAAGVWSFKGRHHTPETVARIKAALTGRKMTPEHRAKIAAGRKAYWERWRANRPEVVAKNAMLADRQRLKAFGEWGEAQSAIVEMSWCGQCEKRVSVEQATSCASPFCKAKALAA